MTTTAQTWTKGTVILATDDGPVETEAHTLDNLAVHRSVRGDDQDGAAAATPWRVSHVPTGMSLGQSLGRAPSEASARARALAVLRVAPEIAAALTVDEVLAQATRLRESGRDWVNEALRAAEDIEAEAQAAADPRAALYGAVKHVLNRAQEDPDVAYVLGPLTEAHRLLCLAEAAHLGRPFDAVEKDRARHSQPEHRRRRPRVVELDEEVQQLRALVHPAQQIVRGHKEGWGLDGAVHDLREALEEAGRAPGPGGDEGGGDEDGD